MLARRVVPKLHLAKHGGPMLSVSVSVGSHTGTVVASDLGSRARRA